MKLLMIRPSGGGFSGAEWYNLGLLSALKKQFPQVHVSFITDTPLFEKKLTEIGVPVCLINLHLKEVGTKKEFLKASVWLPYFLWQYWRLFQRLNKREKVTCVCLQSMTEKIFLTPWLLLCNYTVLWLEHGPMFITNRAKIVKQLYRLLSVLPKKIIVVSQDTKQDLEIAGITKEKIVVLPGGIDTDYFSPLGATEKERQKKQLGIKEKFIIGYVGGITQEKGISEFLAVAREISEKEKHTAFVLVGDGPYLSEAKKLIKEYSLENYVYFLGYREDVRPVLGIMDVFFFPTNHHEGISLALLEAAAMELFVVAHDIGGNKEVVVDGKTGWLYATFSANELAKTIGTILHDTIKFNNIAKNARKLIVTRYNTQKMAQEFYNLVNTV